MRRFGSPKAWITFACLLPLLRLVVLGIGGLGANPIEFITRSTGTWTLVGLLATLSVTPLRRLTGRADFLRHRRMLGLFAFFYACLHLVTYLWLGQFFDAAAIVVDIVKRPFITVGFSAFALLILLAATSTQAMLRRLGRRWQALHRLVYLIAVLGVLHYLWLVKKDLTQPLIYGGVLAMRLPWGVNALQAARTIHANLIPRKIKFLQLCVELTCFARRRYSFGRPLAGGRIVQSVDMGSSSTRRIICLDGIGRRSIFSISILSPSWLP